MKKFLKYGIVALAFAPFLALADATSSITLPTDFNAQIWAQANALFTSFSGFIEMVVGVILAATVLEILVGITTHKK